jgi:hypothetical protein
MVGYQNKHLLPSPPPLPSEGWTSLMFHCTSSLLFALFFFWLPPPYACCGFRICGDLLYQYTYI